MEDRVREAILKIFKEDKQVIKAMYRNNHFTSHLGLEHVSIEMYDKGYYVKARGVQCAANKFFNHDFEIVRKPNKCELLAIYEVKNGIQL